MISKLTLAAVLTAALAMPVLAQETKTIDPASKGPTDAVTGQVPTMKPDGKLPPATTVPDKATNSATPAMMLNSTQFKLQDDRVIADVPAAGAKDLPKVAQ